MHDATRPMPRPSGARTIALAIALGLVAVAPASAQGNRTPKQSAAAASRASQPSAQPATQVMLGAWTGTASVQFGDSTITVPVTYTFTQSANGIAGSALVPGQGSGTISNVTRAGARIQFRVTVAPATVQSAMQGAAQTGKAPAEPTLLEHDGTLGADGALQGMVNHNGQPVAKFKISPKK